MIQFESLLELDFIYLLEFDPTVTWFAEQPLEIPYEFEGKIHHYVPDFHIIRDGHDWLIECKPKKFAESDETRRKAAAASTWCDENGWIFCIVTEDEIRSGNRLQNVKFLLNYARFTVHSEDRTRIYTALHQVGSPITITELTHKLESTDQQTTLITLYHMAFRHEIEISVDGAPISTSSTVSLH